MPQANECQWMLPINPWVVPLQMQFQLCPKAKNLRGATSRSHLIDAHSQQEPYSQLSSVVAKAAIDVMRIQEPEARNCVVAEAATDAHSQSRKLAIA